MAGARDGALAPTPGKNARKRLFDDEGDEEDAGDVGASESLGQPSSFTINEDYARRFEHNKKREEKHKLEEKYGKAAASNGADDDDEEDSSEDESEDEDGYLLTEDLDARMTAALQAIKNKDPRIYNTETKFFDPSEIDQVAEDAANASSSEPKQKPMFLRDYHRERYLRGDIGADDEDEEEASKAAPKTYQQEQDEAKQALIAEMNAAGEDAKGDGEKVADDDEDDDADAFIKPKASSKAAKAEAKASGIHPSRVGRVPKITGEEIANASKNPELFLSNFMASRAWVPEDKEGGPGWRAFESDDDESENDRAEEFEAAYNLRFEDPDKSNEVLKSYSRSVVAQRSVRRDEKTGRQRQREQEKEQEAAEKRERKEERARLRKLRIEEAQEKLAKIKQAAGIRGKEMKADEWTELLDDAWNTEEWEARMHKYFGDAYYAQPDVELGSDDDDEGGDGGNKSKKAKQAKRAKKAKKPKWDDDIDITDIIPDFEDTDPKITLSDAEEDGDEAGEADKVEGDEDEDEDDEDDEDQPAKRRKTTKDRKQERADAKRTARQERARIEALVDRQMELDAPTALAGDRGAAGFRYRETSPQSFGLTPRDILLAPSDSALNEFAGLKKLATFRDEERKRKDRKTLGKKARLRQWRRETFGEDFEMTGPTYGFERLVGDTAAANHPRRKGKDKAKDKTKTKDKADEAEAEKSGKKRKRSGRKGKGKEKGKATEQEA